MAKRIPCPIPGKTWVDRNKRQGRQRGWRRKQKGGLVDSIREPPNYSGFRCFLLSCSIGILPSHGGCARVHIAVPCRRRREIVIRGNCIPWSAVFVSRITRQGATICAREYIYAIRCTRLFQFRSVSSDKYIAREIGRRQTRSCIIWSRPVNFFFI